MSEGVHYGKAQSTVNAIVRKETAYMYQLLE